ncbi:MAG TPA: HNH endonuclease, partial [Anaeromyxobacter sp.]
MIHYPEIVEPLRDGRLCLSSIVEVAKVITPANRAEVLPRFFHLSKRDAKAVSAELLPDDAPPRREVVTSPTRGPAPVTAPRVLPEEPHANFSVPDVSSPPRPRPQTLEVEPLDADLRRLHLTVSRRVLDKLEAARAALSHSHPGAGANEVLEAGLDLLLERAAKRRGLVKKPRKSPPAPTASASPNRKGGRRRDHIPAHVKRAVWERDGGKCQWPVLGGGVCGSTHQLELDHIHPQALGG